MANGYNIPNGSTVKVGFTTAVAIPFTALVPGADLGFTVQAASGLAIGDMVLVRSSLVKLHAMVLRVKTATGTTVTVEGIDGSKASDYPASTTGSLTPYKAADWVTMPFVTAVAVTGGEQQTTTVQWLEAEKATNINTVKSATSQAYTMAHDAAASIRQKLIGADDAGDICPVWFFQKRAKEDRYHGSQISIQRLPTTVVNEVETTVVTFALQNEPTYYAVK